MPLSIQSHGPEAMVDDFTLQVEQPTFGSAAPSADTAPRGAGGIAEETNMKAKHASSYVAISQQTNVEARN